MKSDGATVVVKLDGQRTWDAYTVIVSGGPLGDAYLRADHGSLEEAVARVIVPYAHRC